MGLFSTHWAGSYRGHTIEVVRKMGGHEFHLMIDGKEVDSRSSAVNMGTRELEGKLHLGGKDVVIHATGIQAAFSESAIVTADGEPVSMSKIM